MKTRIIIVCIFIFTAVLHAQNNMNIIDKKVKFGYRADNNRNIIAIIIHSTFNNSGGEKYDIDLVIKQFSKYGVSSHYVIGRDGTVYKLVDEQNVAFHAGKSELPNGQTNINYCSLGIELITDFNEAPTENQLKALIQLVNSLKSRYRIQYVLRHSEIAPDRKTDPWNMNWEQFLNNLNQ